MYKRQIYNQRYGLGQVIHLDFYHSVDTIQSLTANGDDLGDDFWNQRGPYGLEVRNFRPWNLRLVAEYIPVDDNDIRQAVELEIAIIYIGYASQILPQSMNIRVPVADRTREERRALSRLNTNQAPFRLPDKNYIKAQ